ncbi:MAG TPA: DUF1810 domain-containing protein [Leptolyngbyaceae cyanobacterium M65_K2018_010]|nr:DUF1810 domain-containing protein [Leptolyngbyaceae cyanobacterium M65_K2018_010]
MSDPYNLGRFVQAQAPIYPEVLAELRQGHKTQHWMWFIFPQIKGLGRSEMAQKFAITALAEAKAYLDHPLLGPRLRECTQIVVGLEGRSAEEIFGSIDSLKFRSSMTLFTQATRQHQIFQAALLKYFAGDPDPRTIGILKDGPGTVSRD